ncbi:MAG: sensor histidine kinase [Planctomycetota bacterium]
MLRSRSSLLFASILALSFALVAWWTYALVTSGGELVAAGERLAAGDPDGAARALGADGAAGLATEGERRRRMFVSEGAFFAAVMAGLGWLYLAALRRETAAQRTQDRFLAAATPELKTPLATIVLALDTLRDGRIDPDRCARYLATARQEAERLGRGLDNVLSAAGLRATGRATALTAGDLVEDVRRAVEALRGRAEAGAVAVRLDAPATLPARRDETGLPLARRNLLDNAVKFSPPRSAVHVALARDGDTATVTVRDAGRGLDAEELAHLFEPFWRGSDAATGGAGLGLSLVRELVAAHGGTVSAHSDGRDRGACFTVRLPLWASS